MALAIIAVAAATAGAAVLFSGHGNVAAHSTPTTTASVAARGASTPAIPASTTTSTVPSFPPVPAPAPILSDGVRLPETLPASATPIKLPILQFHAVDSRPVRGSWGKRLTLDTQMFKTELDYLASHGYQPVTLEQVYAGMARLEPLPKNPVALTFDDGYLDNYTVAFPILHAHHFAATFFVITGAVGKPGYMTWADLRAMHADGMAIESHTVRHQNLDTLTDADLAAELTQSRAAIAAEVGQVPAALSYPGGDYDQRVAAATKVGGYLMAVTTRRGDLLGPSNPYAWPRTGVGPKETLSGFVHALEQIPTSHRQPSRKPLRAPHSMLHAQAAPGGSA